MTYSNYKYQPQYLAEKRAALTLQVKGRPLLDVLRSAVIEKLKADKSRYLQFGPYWPAVKAAIRDAYNFGDFDEPLIRSEYCGRDAAGAFDPELTLIAGTDFAEDYLAQMFKGTRHFELESESSEDDPLWGLFDPDMEHSG